MTTNPQTEQTSDKNHLGADTQMVVDPIDTPEQILLEAINEGWFLRSKSDYPNGFTGADVRAIQNKALAALDRYYHSQTEKAEIRQLGVIVKAYELYSHAATPFYKTIVKSLLNKNERYRKTYGEYVLYETEINHLKNQLQADKEKAEMSKMYVISDGINSEDLSGYWYEKEIPTLAMAEAKAKAYPGANIIIEYQRKHGKPEGWLPTGKTWDIAASTLLKEEKV